MRVSLLLQSVPIGDEIIYNKISFVATLRLLCRLSIPYVSLSHTQFTQNRCALTKSIVFLYQRLCVCVHSTRKAFCRTR